MRRYSYGFPATSLQGVRAIGPPVFSFPEAGSPAVFPRVGTVSPAVSGKCLRIDLLYLENVIDPGIIQLCAQGVHLLLHPLEPFSVRAAAPHEGSHFQPPGLKALAQLPCLIREFLSQIPQLGLLLGGQTAFQTLPAGEARSCSPA